MSSHQFAAVNYKDRSLYAWCLIHKYPKRESWLYVVLSAVLKEIIMSFGLHVRTKIRVGGVGLRQ